MAFGLEAHQLIKNLLKQCYGGVGIATHLEVALNEVEEGLIT